MSMCQHDDCGGVFTAESLFSVYFFPVGFCVELKVMFLDWSTRSEN